jgi:hypothetical protein
MGPNSPAPACKVLKNNDYPTTAVRTIAKINHWYFRSFSRTFSAGAGIVCSPGVLSSFAIARTKSGGAPSDSFYNLPASY